MHDVALGWVAVAHMADVMQKDGAAGGRGLDRQIVHAGDCVGGIVEPHGVLEAADLDVAGRHDLVLGGEGVLHVGGGKSARLHSLGVEIDLN
jgi:hypothetical protein